MTTKARITHERIDNLYDRLTNALQRWQGSSKAYQDDKASLDAHYLNSLANGAVAGSNESKRRADHQQKFPEFYIENIKLLDEMDADKFDVDLIRIDESRVKSLLRVDEMVVRAGSDV